MTAQSGIFEKTVSTPAQQVILGTGAGACGLNLLAEILQKQHDSRVSFEERPILPWIHDDNTPGIRERIDRWKNSSDARFIGDVSPFYLPYVDEAVEFEPCLKIICLKRPRSEVVAATERFLDAHYSVPTNHWSKHPADGWFHDPLWSQAYPQYDTQDRTEGIGLYWDEFYERSENLAIQYPDKFLLIDTLDLTSLPGVSRLLDFIGIPPDQQVPIVGQAPSRSFDDVAEATGNRPAKSTSTNKDCVVLVPYNGFIHPECEDALKELERRGYSVRRVGGYAAIDQGRNQMATDALIDDFGEPLFRDWSPAFDAISFR
jgi:hypothetical protein